MATNATNRRNPRRTAEANATAKPKRKTRRGSAKSKRKREQARSEQRSWQSMDAGMGQNYQNGLPSNATHNQQTTYVSPAAAKAARDELLARLGLTEARPKI